MKVLDLRRGFGNFEDYEMFKFPGGEVHFRYKADCKDPIRIEGRFHYADMLIALGIVVDTFKSNGCPYIEVFIPYMPYGQADRKFSEGESFSLKTITLNWLNQLPVDKYIVFDPHSDVTPALLKSCEVVDNSEFIHTVLATLYPKKVAGNASFIVDKKQSDDNLILLAPDAGAYKKIFHLAKKLNFDGEVMCCQKHRDPKSGKIELEVPVLGLKDILVVDDICVGGATFRAISQQAPKRKRSGLIRALAVSHVIDGVMFKKLYDEYDTLFATDSRQPLMGVIDNRLSFSIFKDRWHEH